MPKHAFHGQLPSLHARLAMETPDESQETQPLRDGSLQVLDIEKHVLNPEEPREVMRQTELSRMARRRTFFGVLLLVMGSLAILALEAVREVLASKWRGNRPAEIAERGRHEGATRQTDIVAYDFVGEGNCKPNRPQWAKEAPYEECRATCDLAIACIGFDWDARWTFCRVRFSSNLVIAGPPRGFQAFAGEEGGTLSRQVAKKGNRGIEGIEGSHTAGCFLKASAVPFYRFLSHPTTDNHDNPLVGPLPNILEYYRETGLLGPLQTSKRMLQVEDGLLAYSGAEGEMILPSLDVTPVIKFYKMETFVSVTIIVGVNSDSHCCGLGVAVEASPQINETKEHTQWLGRGDAGVHLNRNLIKFIPDTVNAGVEVEGPGGFRSTPIGFTLPGWSRSGRKLNILEISMEQDGKNTLVLRSAMGDHVWRKSWRHKLFDGKDLPSLYAFIARGGEQGRPLLVGRVSLKMPAYLHSL